jgi:SHOCT-like domain
MSRERTKILQMVADGTITPEDAEKLLARLDSPGPTTATMAGSGPEDGDAKSGPLKYLRVVVDGSDRVNIRVPIGLVRTGIKLTTLIPRQAGEHLKEHGVDLSRFNNLDGEELMEALRELKVDVDTKDGDVIRVFCE